MTGFIYLKYAKGTLAEQLRVAASTCKTVIISLKNCCNDSENLAVFSQPLYRCTKSFKKFKIISQYKLWWRE